MTDNEYAKILEDLHDKILNDNCLLEKVDHNELYALFHTRSILERQEAEIEELYKSLDNRILEIEAQKAEIERLTRENQSFADIGKFYSEIKSEAIKEFWEKVKTKKQWDVDVPDYVFISDGDTLVKEMAGENNG